MRRIAFVFLLLCLAACARRMPSGPSWCAGRWIVSCGVWSAGVPGPNAAIELGKNTAQPRSRAASSML